MRILREIFVQFCRFNMHACARWNIVFKTLKTIYPDSICTHVRGGTLIIEEQPNNKGRFNMHACARWNSCIPSFCFSCFRFNMHACARWNFVVNGIVTLNVGFNTHACARLNALKTNTTICYGRLSPRKVR